MHTTGAIALIDNEMWRRLWSPRRTPGPHECSRGEFGLQMDSTEAFLGSAMALQSVHNSMKRESLEVVARDGIEPPTPAFSGLRSTN